MRAILRAWLAFVMMVSLVNPVFAQADNTARGLAVQANSTATIAQTIGSMPSVGPLIRYMHVGDSLVQAASDERTNTYSPCDLTSCDALVSGGILLPIRASGIGGQPSQLVAARAVRDILKYRPDLVLLTVGTNNIIIQNAAVNQPDVQKIIDVCRSLGIPILLTTIPPSSVGAGDPALINTTNTIIRSIASLNNLPPPVDYFAISNDPANPGHYRANRTFDGRHPIATESLAWAQADWAAIQKYVLPNWNRAQTRPQSDVANLLFSPISNLTGLPSNTSTRDPLFINHRSFSQNGYTLDLPYLFGATFPSGVAPSVISTVAPDAAVVGNALKLTVTPNGVGTFSAQTASLGRSIDLARYQGRRIRWSFMMMQSGASVDNTDAYLAANGNVPISGCSINVATHNSTGATIASLNAADPLDSSLSLGQASTVGLDTQVLPMTGGVPFDYTWRPFNFEFSVAPGAVEGVVTVNCGFKAGAVSPITVGLGEMSFVDVGKADDFRGALTISNPEYGFLNVSASTTLTTGQVFTIPTIRADATSAAITITLPASTQLAGRIIRIKKIDSSANTVTIAGTSENIDGSPTLIISAQYKTVTLQSNGAGWDVIATTA